MPALYIRDGLTVDDVELGIEPRSAEEYLLQVRLVAAIWRLALHLHFRQLSNLLHCTHT